MRRGPGLREDELPPGTLASVWRDEGYVEAAYMLDERIGMMTDGGAMTVEEAQREAHVHVRAWWRRLTPAERRRLRG